MKLIKIVTGAEVLPRRNENRVFDVKWGILRQIWVINYFYTLGCASYCFSLCLRVG